MYIKFQSSEMTPGKIPTISIMCFLFLPNSSPFSLPAATPPHPAREEAWWAMDPWCRGREACACYGWPPCNLHASSPWWAAPWTALQPPLAAKCPRGVVGCNNEAQKRCVAQGLAASCALWASRLCDNDFGCTLRRLTKYQARIYMACH